MNVTQGLRRVRQTNPEGIATVDGDRRRSWREIGERVARLAGGLRELGVNRGDRVAVLMLNSDRYLELYLGIAWAGAVIVPTNIRWSHAEIEDSLHDCRASVGPSSSSAWISASGTAFASSTPMLAKALSTTRTEARQSCSESSISAWLHRMLMGTITAPAQAMPR